jgi:hypothetical protein
LRLKGSVGFSAMPRKTGKISKRKKAVRLSGLRENSAGSV